MKKARRAEHEAARNEGAAARAIDEAISVLCCATGALGAVLTMLQGKDGEDADRCRGIVYLVAGALGECSESLEEALELLQ